MLEPVSQSVRLQSVQFAILKQCILICERHHLRYFLLGGSALGAARHSGFIPWDDDIDLGMPRPDYEKFLSLAQAELTTELFLQTNETDPHYPLTFAKIRNSRTTFIQPTVSHLDMNHGVFIDIFPLDGYPASAATKVFNTLRFKLFRATILHKHNIKHAILPIRLIVSFFGFLASLPWLTKKIDSLMKSYEYDKSSIVTNWNGTWGAREALDREVFGAGLQVQFEGLAVMIPKNYGDYLKALYDGNYMDLPPVEKRVSHHSIVLIDLDTSYTNHLEKKQ